MATTILITKDALIKKLKMIGYPYINMEVSMLKKARFKLRETLKVYHLGIMKLLPLAPAYILIARKTRQDSI